MAYRYIGVKQLHRAAAEAGYTMRPMTDPMQGRNDGWGIFLNTHYVANTFSFKIEPVSEQLCTIGRAELTRLEAA